MKKTFLKIVALVLVAVVACAALVSCAKTVSGSYKGEINVGIAAYEVVYEFKGSKVEVTRQLTSMFGNADPVVVEGEYEITEKADGDLQITFTYPTDNKDEVIKGGTFDFEEGDDYIKIGVAKYTKLDK